MLFVSCIYLIFFNLLLSWPGNCLNYEQGNTRIKRSVFMEKSNRTKVIVTYATAAPRPSIVLEKPRFVNTQTANLKFDEKSNLCNKKDTTEKCNEKTKNHKIRIMNEFRRVLTLNARSSKQEDNSSNPYNVTYKMSSMPVLNQSRDQLICDLQTTEVKTTSSSDYPFDTREIGKWFPKNKLFEKEVFESCAIIANAGSLLGSNLGNFIDSHDVVLRFNHAPTKGYEKDVGNKTTFRIVNSQVMTQDRFSFATSDLYRGDGVLLGWDPSAHGASLASWAAAPEHDLFTAYAAYMRQGGTDQQPAKGGFYILQPETLWTLWEFLQRRTEWKLRRNPPTSGFLGIAVLLPHCRTLHVMEYIPSARLSSRCHYFDSAVNSACTFGSWHPLAAEKLLTWRMNEAEDHEVLQRGYITIKRKTC